MHKIHRSQPAETVPEASTATEIITGATGIQNRLAALCAAAEQEVATFAPGGPQKPERIADARLVDEEMFARGIYSRTIFLSSLRYDRTTLDHVAWLNENGAEVRTAPTLPIRMIIQDKKIAVLPIDPNNTMRGIVVNDQPGVVLALQALFEMVWATSIPLGETFTRNEYGLTSEDQIVLELLALGRTSTEIGASMGFTERTARRKTNSILERLGTEAPFRGGYLAVKNGWL